MELYFAADDPELFTLDNQGNLSSIPVNPGNPNGSFAGEDGGFIQFANQLYYNAERAGTPEVLFSLGADNVAHPVTDAHGHDIETGSGIPAEFTIYDGSLYFIGFGSLGTDLFKVDPTGAVSELNVNPGGYAFPFSFSENFGFTQFDGDLFFTASTPATTSFDQTGLFFITPAGVFDGAHDQVLYQGQSLGDAGEDGGFFSFNGGMFFNAVDPTTLQSELFKLDVNGTPTRVLDGSGAPFMHPDGKSSIFHGFNGSLYFTEQGEGVPGSGGLPAEVGLFRLDPNGNATEVVDPAAGRPAERIRVRQQRRRVVQRPAARWRHGRLQRQPLLQRRNAAQRHCAVQQ